MSVSMEMMRTADRRTTRLGYLTVAVSAILFSAKSVFIKICFAHGATPMAVIALRSGFSLPFFVGMALYPRFSRSRSTLPPLSRRDLIIIAGLGLLGFYVASVLNIIGLLYVSAGTERLILYVYPSLVVILSAWIFRKPIPRQMILPLVLSYAGIALSFGSELAEKPGGNLYLGGILIFLSALSYALFLVGQGKLVHRVGPQRLGAYAMLAASVAVFVQYALVKPLHELLQPAIVYWMTGITAVFCTVVPVYLVGYGVRAIGTGRAAIVSSVGPVSTFAMAALLLGEAPGILQMAGLGLVLLSSLILASGSFSAVPNMESDLDGAGKLGLEVVSQGKTSPSSQSAGETAYQSSKD